MLFHQTGIDDCWSSTVSARGSDERHRLRPRVHSRRDSPSEQGWEPRSGAMQEQTRTGTVGVKVFSRGSITSHADHRHDHQNNLCRNHGDATIVSHGPFSRYPIEICRRSRQWTAKQDGISKIVKLECDNVAQNCKCQGSNLHRVNGIGAQLHTRASRRNSCVMGESTRKNIPGFVVIERARMFQERPGDLARLPRTHKRPRQVTLPIRPEQ